MRRFTKLTSCVAGQARRFARDESGATAIEYALITAGIAVAIIAAVNSIGTTTNAKFESVSTGLK
ncbi:MAG TPA: Flp family type IVb pilin [Xanthobacteraceae bacterium]|nr:Flp family type IVb pilin [Xanthobacteraceae bacterium]